MDGKKLKRLLDLKKRLEKVKKGEVVEARQELETAESHLNAAKREQQKRLEDMQGEQTLSVDELQDRARFVVLAGKQVSSAHAVVEARNQVVAQREEQRIEATRDVRTFELLSERHKAERALVEKRLEQAQADEVGASLRRRS